MSGNPPGLPTVEVMASRVRAHRPRVSADVWAATALIVGSGSAGPSVLLIRRLAREGDPWSGDMALPGGKVDPGDASAEAAAARETAEEVGIVLGPPVGRLDDLAGPRSTRAVATLVYVLDGLPTAVPEPGEVAEAVWLPLRALTDPAARTWHRYGGVVPFPSLTVDSYMIWGLTHRMLTSFFDIAGLT